MEKNRNFIKGILCGVCLPIFVIVILAFFNIANIGSLFQSLYIMETKGLESLSITEKVEGAIGGMVNELEDPYSYYLDANEFSTLMQEVSGTYMGIGVYLLKEEGAEYVSILSPIKSTPAFDAGLEAGDEILSLNGESVQGATADIVSEMVKNAEGKNIKLEIRRNGEIKEYAVERTDIDIPTVEGEFLQGQEGIAYISISQFNDVTPNDLNQVLKDLQGQGTIQGLILDVRNNPGGSVPSVEQVAETFLTQGSKILWIQEKDEETSFESKNTNPISIPMVVLINENSASAAEILSGALQDNEVATLVGTKTFGKGIIQTVYSLKDGGAVKITTARYLSPNRHEIHEIGVSPDVDVPLNTEDTKVIYSKDIEKDNQLKKALEELEKKMAE